MFHHCLSSKRTIKRSIRSRDKRFISPAGIALAGNGWPAPLRALVSLWPVRLITRVRSVGLTAGRKAGRRGARREFFAIRRGRRTSERHTKQVRWRRQGRYWRGGRHVRQPQALTAVTGVQMGHLLMPQSGTVLLKWRWTVSPEVNYD